MTVRTVLAGTDGSPDAAVALTFAAGLARDTRARLVVTHAAGLLDAAQSPGPHTELRAALEGAWTEPARAVGIDVHTVLRDGNPVEVLLDVADDVEADIIAVGSRGVGAFQLLGSTSSELTRRSHRPVVVVPRNSS